MPLKQKQESFFFFLNIEIFEKYHICSRQINARKPRCCRHVSLSTWFPPKFKVTWEPLMKQKPFVQLIPDQRCSFITGWSTDPINIHSVAFLHSTWSVSEQRYYWFSPVFYIFCGALLMSAWLSSVKWNRTASASAANILDNIMKTLCCFIVSYIHGSMLILVKYSKIILW